MARRIKPPPPLRKACKRCRVREPVANAPAAYVGLCKICLEAQLRFDQKQAEAQITFSSVKDFRAFQQKSEAARKQIIAAAEGKVIAPEDSAPAPADDVDVKKAVENIRRWRKDPVAFVREVFGAVPDAWQEETLRAVVDCDKICLKACKGPGKSCVASWIAWWFLTCFEHPNILATSITGDNLRDGLWKEMAYWRTKSPMLKDLFEWTSERIMARQHRETWFMSARQFSKSADSNQQANTLAGLHARNTMIILDEAGDIPEGVLAAGLAHHSTQGAEREVHKTIMLGNPTRTEGPLWNACTRDRAQWWVKEITGDPDALDRAPRIDKGWALEQINTWGRDNPWVLVNVFGKFPPAQADKLLGPDEVRAAMTRVVAETAWREEPRIMGLDVARFGDDRSVLVRRQGSIVFPVRVYRNQDLMDLSAQVAYEFGQFKARVILVDETGIGAGVADRLRQLGLPVIGINFGSKAPDSHFADRRSYMWWHMAEAVKKQLCLPDDPEWVAELTGPSFFFDKTSRMRLESKDDLKKRGLSSPDKADALALTWAEVVQPEIRVPRMTQESLQQAFATESANDYDPFDEERI